MNANRGTTSRIAMRIGGSAIAAVMAYAAIAQAPVAMAAESASQSSAPGVVIATQASASAIADRPASITVIDHDGQPVTVATKGEKPRVARKAAGQAVTFTGLTLGKPYTVMVGTELLGAVVPVTTPGAASRLVVSTTNRDGEVALGWKQEKKANTGTLTYRAKATSPGNPIIEATIVNGGTLSGLDLDARYTFTVTPYSTAGAGKAAVATMSKTLRELGAVSGTPAAPVPVKDVSGGSTDQPAAPTQPTGPAGPGAPRTKTIWVCPDGYGESGDGCTKTAPYTYTTIPYTYHPETRTWTVRVVDAAVPAGDSWQPGCADGWCPTAWHDETRSETTMVKDAAPAGYSDTGSGWSKRDDGPAGYADDGSQWVASTGKVAKEVPA